jgi:hypothetical protein
MTKPHLRSLKMLVAGMAAAFLAGKGRVAASPGEVEPLTQPLVPPGESVHAFLFGSEGDPRGALREHVRRHARELNSLSLMLSRLREVAADAADAIPSNLPSNIILPQAMPAQATDWSLFDPGVFDVSDRGVVWTSGLGRVSGSDDEDLFERAPMNIIATRNGLSRRTAQPGA